MSDIEIIEFKTPTGSSTSIYLSQFVCEGLEESQNLRLLHEHFSKWGLIYNINLSKCDSDPSDYYCYVRYYSVRAACKAKRENKGTVVLEGGQLKFRVSGSTGGRGSCGLPLARSKCEELANYYLGFNGWSSQVMYHRKEDICPGTLCYVTVVKLSFPQSGLDCEGGGKCEAPEEGDVRLNQKILSELGKRSKGEAVQAAWSKVVLVVVDGSKVSLEINTTKQEKFFYDPTWDEPVIQVNHVDGDFE